ncbi:7,8-dihydroneopterin aldolase [Alsobacter metallidurans]|uniref:7,8-dihydroneopterin aldolase n=1 Tax=Alsobacter metallidurans TaxID=340221 RepID=A0A917IAI7_9HYPH|nr:dihydroneopterin aldolase [Alsobacter metallidurans]GGH33151.1 7,8-dihydroneopterin aldolase [Alsobacter metallidurans]
MTDRVTLSRLAVYARHGVLPEEATLGQRFYITLTCELDLRPAGAADDYNQAVCYGALADLVVGIATQRRFKIIEGLAEAIASAVLAGHPRVGSVTVKVEKPEAPVQHILDTVAVEIERHRG